VFVNDSTTSGFEGRRKCSSCLSDIIVNHWLELAGLIADQKSTGHEEELGLLFIEITHVLDQEGYIALLLAEADGWRVFASRREIGTVPGAPDLGQALGSAAHGADVLAKRRARPARSSPTAERARHHRLSLYG